MTVISVQTYPSPEENVSTSNSVRIESESGNSTYPYSMTQEILQNRRLITERGRWFPQLFALVIGNNDCLKKRKKLTFEELVPIGNHLIPLALYISACISSISQGTVLGWSAPAVNTLAEGVVEQEATLSVRNFAWICSLAPLGCSFGVVVWTYLNITMGPRKTMLFQAPFLFTTWIALSLVQKAELTYAGRFFSGFFSISYKICGETLLLDCVHKNNMKYMIMAFRSCVSVGILLSYMIGFLWTEKFYYTCSSAIVVGIHFVLLMFVPESPVFLYDKSPKQAEKSLTWYRGSRNIVLEMREIKRDSEIRNLDPSSFKYMLLAKVVIKGILIVVGMAMFQIMNGYYLFMFYNLIICKGSKSHLATTATTVISKFADAVVIGLTILFSKIAAIHIHYTVPYGVKKPLLLSGFCTAFCLLSIAVYNTLRQIYPNTLRSPHWFNLIGAVGVIVSYELGLGEYPTMMLYYYMPYQVYSRAKLIVNFTHWFMCFVFIQYFIELQEAMTYSPIMFFVLGIGCLCSLLFTRMFIVEFKNQTLIQIQLQLGGNPIGSRGRYRRFPTQVL